jgi:hypothetical protein
MEFHICLKLLHLCVFSPLANSQARVEIEINLNVKTKTKMINAS